MNTPLTIAFTSESISCEELELIPISHDMEEARYQAVSKNLDTLSAHFTWCPATFNRNGNNRLIANRKIQRNRGLGYYFVIVNLQREIVGEIGIDCILTRQRTGNVFYWICSTHTRKGWATQALKSLARWARSLPEIDRLQVCMDVENTGSQKAAKKAGALYQKTTSGFVRASSKHCLMHTYTLCVR